jgi:hypothetical protein
MHQARQSFMRELRCSAYLADDASATTDQCTWLDRMLKYYGNLRHRIGHFTVFGTQFLTAVGVRS